MVVVVMVVEVEVEGAVLCVKVVCGGVMACLWCLVIVGVVVRVLYHC